MEAATAARARALVNRIDASRSHDQVALRQDLGALVGARLPDILLEAVPTTRAWDVRATLVTHCGRFSRESRAAREAGLLAPKDRSKHVRQHGFRLLAYARDQGVLPILHEMREPVSDRSRGDP